MSERLEAALTYARRGWPVFPLHGISRGRCTCGKECSRPAKHPLTEHGFQNATTDEETIKGWWGRAPQANIGLRAGAASGFVVLDVDPRHGGDESLRDLRSKHGALPDTVQSLTGGGGQHFLFAHPGKPVANKQKLRPGLDVKGDGGYIVAPPSDHVSGQCYEWEASSAPGETALAPLPDWLAALLAGGEGRQEAPPIPGRIPEGERNATLASLAGTMRRRGASREAILAALLVENESCDPEPLPRAEVEGIADSIARYEPTATAGHPEEDERWEGLGVVSLETAAAHANGSKPNVAGWEPAALPAEHYVPRYLAYAQSRTDAPPQYHEALAMLQLSAAVGPHLRIPLASKPAGMLCSLWLMILGKSTSYRKSTSEDLAVDILRAIEPDMFLANDQSPQGFIEEMSYRDGKVAVWHRDEFRSFLAQIKNAGWMAGGKELLMKLFDGAAYYRRLRTKKVKGEMIPDEARVNKPYLVTLAAGVTTRIIDVLTVDDVIDGFLPRFLVVMPTVLPPRRKAATITESIEGERWALIGELRCLKAGFAERGECAAQFDADAWERWNEYAAQIESQAEQSVAPELSGPIAGRMSDSALKLAALLQAAADGAPASGSNLHVPLSAIETAIQLCERFRSDAEDLAMQIGSSTDERRLTRFMEMVKRQPGIGRYDVSRALKVDKRQMDNLEATAIDRDLVRCSTKTTRGRSAKVYWLAPAEKAPESPELTAPTGVR